MKLPENVPIITNDTIFFFDMDGTLIDTNYANFLAYKKAIISVTNSFHDLTYDSENRFNRGKLEYAIPNLIDRDYEFIIREKEKFYNDYLRETKLINKNFDILLKYSKANKTVLVTNCRENRAIATLEYHGLIDKFNYFFYRLNSNYEVKINKFENAISALNISPNLVVAFENEEEEIADAKKAGIKLINPGNI